MGHIVLPFIEAVVGFIVIAATAMSGVSLWLRYRAQSRPEGTTALEDLREENVELRTRMTELEERVDFVERRMIQEQPPLRLPPQPERTPV
jgi:cell division protein FtsB